MLGRIPFGVRPNVLPTLSWSFDPFQIFGRSRHGGDARPL